VLQPAAKNEKNNIFLYLLNGKMEFSPSARCSAVPKIWFLLFLIIGFQFVYNMPFGEVK